MTNRTYRLPRGLVSLLVVSMLAVLLVQPVMAQGEEPTHIYVNPQHVGNEAGTQTQPYNTVKEARAYAQATQNGAFVCICDGDNCPPERCDFVPPARLGAAGEPIAKPIVLASLAVLALILIGAGMVLRARSKRPVAAHTG